MESSSEAGRLWGRAKAHLVFSSILMPDFCEYPIDATLISTKKYQVREEVIIGRGHARRDALGLLFPPTTLYQLIRLPSRGPKLSIREEEQLVIKLLQPVYAARSQSDQTAVSVEQRSQLAPTFATGSRPASLECPKLSNRGMVGASWRSFQNSTPYYVVVYGNGIPLGRFAPCSESVLLLPRGGLRLKAIATIPDDNGQHEAEAVLGLNDELTGWQVLSLHEKTSTLR